MGMEESEFATRSHVDLIESGDALQSPEIAFISVEHLKAELVPGFGGSACPNGARCNWIGYQAPITLHVPQHGGPQAMGSNIFSSLHSVFMTWLKIINLWFLGNRSSALSQCFIGYIYSSKSFARLVGIFCETRRTRQSGKKCCRNEIVQFGSSET